MGTIEHGVPGHQCPPYVLNGEECEALQGADDYGLLFYRKPEDAAFWVPHQQVIGRMVEFNLWTSTIDDIMTHCGYPESERARLAEDHRIYAENFLKEYCGPIEGSVPLLGDASPSTVS